jgi:uncharacterized protein YeaO (DUF488 family)
MSIFIVQLGSARSPGEGLRIGTVRRPPRGIPKTQFASRKFTAEMRKPEAARVLDLLAALSHHSNFSVGCYCADEARCHRSILRTQLKERGARMS